MSDMLTVFSRTNEGASSEDADKFSCGLGPYLASKYDGL